MITDERILELADNWWDTEGTHQQTPIPYHPNGVLTPAQLVIWGRTIARRAFIKATRAIEAECQQESFALSRLFSY
jgi:hypothetical protein